MPCECKTDIEQKLLARFKEQAPEAAEHETELMGYSIALDSEMNMSQKGCMTIEAKAVFPLRKGGTKARKINQTMFFTFCPFCGVKY